MTDLIDTTEMYLRTIYELEEEGIVPLRARIAERLGHSGPTVSQTVARMERDVLMAALLDGLSAALREFAARRFAAFAARWNLCHAWQGETVVLLDDGVVRHEGRAAGVDDSGRLLLDTVDGRITVMAGDVSLRVKA